MMGGFRLMLALMVVFSHSWIFAFGAEQRIFVREIGIGNVAVMGCFILSGFIISEAVDWYYPNRPMAFLTNRALRLLPPFWMATIVAILVHALLASFGVLRLPNTQSPNMGIMFSPENLLVQTTAI